MTSMNHITPCFGLSIFRQLMFQIYHLTFFALIINHVDYKAGIATKNPPVHRKSNKIPTPTGAT